MKVCLDCLDRRSLEIICCAIVRFEISTKTRIELVLDPDTANVFIVSTSSKFLQPEWQIASVVFRLVTGW